MDLNRNRRESVGKITGTTGTGNTGWKAVKTVEVPGTSARHHLLLGIVYRKDHLRSFPDESSKTLDTALTYVFSNDRISNSTGKE